MKKKIIATLAASALVIGLGQAQPAEAFQDDSSLSLYGLGQNSDKVFMFYDKMEHGDMFYLRIGADYTPIATGIFPNAEGMLILDKELYPSLENINVEDSVYVEIVEPAKTVNGQGRTKLFKNTVQRSSYVPASITLDQALLSRGGTNQDVGLIFDENYTPGFADKVTFKALDKDGNAILGKTEEFSVTDKDLRPDGLSKKRLFVAEVSPPDTAYNYQVTFSSSGRIVDNLSLNIPVGDYFGRLAEIEIEANRIVQSGQEASVKVIGIDTEGNRRDVTAQSRLIYDTDKVTPNMDKNGSFTVKEGQTVGSTFKVTAIFNGQGNVMTFEVGESANKIKLQPSTGIVGQEAKVDFQLVDANGKNVALSWEPTEASVRYHNADNPAAALTANVTDFGNLDLNGSGSMTLSSTAAVNIEILITLKNANQSVEYSAGNFSFKAPNQEKINVIMGIGSSQLFINGKQAEMMETPPVILEDRTFVPLRALVEAFGAEVDFNYDRNREITIKLGEDVIIMNVGSKNYTINGKVASMDVAPYIVSEVSRTMVPLRFAVEGLGYKVDANYHADGRTANVVISNFE